MKKNNLIDCVPEDTPLPDEIEALTQAEEEISNNKLISHQDINWN